MAGARDVDEVEASGLPGWLNLDDTGRHALQLISDWRNDRLDTDAMSKALNSSPTLKARVQAIAERVDLSTASDALATVKTDCLEAIRAADLRESNVKHFPFMRLPLELRRMVYQCYVDQQATKKKRRLRRIANLTPSEACSQWCLRETRNGNLDISLGLLNRQTSDEFLEVMYQTRPMFCWSCTCQLEFDLTNNMLLRNGIKRVRIIWTAPRAAEAFKLLRSCKRLRRLELIVTRLTTDILDSSPTLMQAAYLSHAAARGVHELMKLRGLRSVEVFGVVSPPNLH